MEKLRKRNPIGADDKSTSGTKAFIKSGQTAIHSTSTTLYLHSDSFALSYQDKIDLIGTLMPIIHLISPFFGSSNQISANSGFDPPAPFCGVSPVFFECRTFVCR